MPSIIWVQESVVNYLGARKCCVLPVCKQALSITWVQKMLSITCVQESVKYYLGSRKC